MSIVRRASSGPSAVGPPESFAKARRGLIAVGVVLWLAIGAVGGSLIATQRTAILDETWQATGNLAQVLAEQTSRSIENVDLALRALRERLALIATDSAVSPELVMRSAALFGVLGDELNGLPQVDALSVVGVNGQLLNYSRAYPAEALDISDRDYFKHLRDSDDHGIVIGGPAKSLLTGEWTMILARRFMGANGEFAGVVLAVISLGRLEDFYRAAMPANTGVTVLRRDGTIFVHFPHNELRVGTKLRAEAPWYRLVDAGGGSYRSPGYIDDHVSLVSVRPLRDFPLVIDVNRTEEVALSGWRRDAIGLAIGAVLAAAAATALLWVFGVQLHRRMLSELSLARQNAELAQSRMQFDVALDNMSQGVTFFDGDQKLIVCNRRYREICRLSHDQTRAGLSLADIIDHRISLGSFPDISRDDYLERRRTLSQPGTPFEAVDELSNGRVVLLCYQPLPNGGWVTTHEDITERRRAEADLAFMARHDALTTLANRTLFQERLTEAIATTRPECECALLCMDLDGFKVVNDTLGHPVGDALLQAVARRLSSVIRDADTLARLGGDEFSIIQVGLESPDRAAVLAERAIAVVAQPFDIEGNRILIGASVGVAIAPADGTSHEALLRSADIALYLAKSDGRGTYRLFEPEMDARVQKRRGLELDLRHALAADAFELHYQPIVDLQSSTVVGFEALIRWNHPVRGLVSPVDFIPIAEDTGLIVPIGTWVVLQACREATAWPANIGVAVNLSAVQFKGGRLLDAVREALNVSGLAPNRLELEITESVLLQNSDDGQALLHQLRGLGVRIALDDFGTGYSSLSYLRSFPFHKIKIDRSFIGDLITNRDSQIIVCAIIGLAGGLGMTVTAEGVETAEQMEMLRDNGCALVQGDLFSRPVPAAKVAALIRTLGGPRMFAEAAEG
jgi:diguanylate cyclase (GGDEF)-like protein